MYTVIVVDDECDLRKGLIKKIDWESIGFRVIGEADNGIEALDLVEKLEPDLLLTDVKMPFMSGIELARQVREIRPTIQIAFLSGYDDFSYAQQAIQYNIVSYMLKPISSDEMKRELQKIKKIIDEKFEAFTGSIKNREKAEVTQFVMPLLIDPFQEQFSASREMGLRGRAQECGLISSDGMNLKYTVIVTKFLDEEGGNCTTEENISAVNTILDKYVRHTNCFVGDRIVSLLVWTQRDMSKYLHILVEDIVQSVKRIMNREVMVGISRTKDELQQCYGAYSEAMKAVMECNSEVGMIRYISDIERLTGHGTSSNEKSSSGSDICDKALELIKTDFANPEISLVSISDDIAVSPNYLSALIKKSTGSTFIELLTKKRIETAKGLLLNSELKIREITEECGYSDQHYFSYCFKKYTGVSPNGFRRENEKTV
ncbi:MAG: response regulator [Eubacteriales bacterium]